jgi:hypothetical protein
MLSHVVGESQVSSIHLIVNRLSPAFGFHLVTFKERLQSVTETLKVVEKLRQYRPKRVKASGTRTRGLSEKDHFNWVSSALRAVTPDTIRHRDDIEDLDAEEKSKGKEKRKSAPINLNNAATMSSEPPSRPITPPLTMPDAGLNSNGLDEGATLMHTTKPGKAGILAKGKNIIGGGEIYGQLQLGWQVNSAREAKVRVPYCTQPWSEYTIPFSASRVLSTWCLKTDIERTSCRPTFILPSLLKRKLLLRSEFLIKTTMVTYRAQKSRRPCSKFTKSASFLHAACATSALR